jgi:hypothetical protein
MAQLQARRLGLFSLIGSGILLTVLAAACAWSGKVAESVIEEAIFASCDGMADDVCDKELELAASNATAGTVPASAQEKADDARAKAKCKAQCAAQLSPGHCKFFTLDACMVDGKKKMGCTCTKSQKSAPWWLYIVNTAGH